MTARGFGSAGDEPPHYVSYGMAILLVAAALAVRSGLGYKFGPMPTWVTFYPALIFAALIGGIGPGLLATALGAFLADLFFIPSAGSLRVVRPGDLVGLIIFCCNGVLISFIAARMRSARSEAEVARQSEERFRALADNMAQLAWIADGGGYIFWYNKRWYEYTGIALEEMAKREWHEFLPPDRASGFADVARRSLTACVRWEDTLPLRGADGQYRWFLVNAVPICDNRGRVWRWFTTGTDITAEKEAEEILRRYELLAGNSRDIILFMRLDDGRILEANDAAAQEYGYCREELLSLTIQDIRAPDTRDLTSPQMAEASSTGILFETSHRRKDGTIFPVEVSSRGATVAGVQTLISVIRNITNRRKGQDALKESERRWATTLESIGDAVIATDRSSRITYMNPVAEGLTGWTMKEALERPVEEVFNIVDEYSRQKAANPVTKVLEEGGIVTLANHTILLRRDGREVPIDDSGAPIKEKEGEITGVVLVFRNITARRSAEEALRRVHAELERRVEERTAELQDAYDRLMEETREREKAEAQLRQAQKMDALGTLSGGIAHDFNNILAAILGFTEMVRGRLPEGGRDAHSLDRVMEAGLRGRDLVKQMLTFSRKGEMERRPLQLSHLVKESMKLLRASIPTTVGIRVKADSDSGLILGDPVQMQQVLFNLCTNAAHAMKEDGGNLDIELSPAAVTAVDGDPAGLKAGSYVKLAVRDTGCGIDPEIIDKIWDPFFTTKKPGEGTGLGLSVVHGIIKQHDAFITVESEVGKGCAFTAYFPRISEAGSAAPSPKEAIPTGGERVLFIDDEDALIDMGKELLAELGYRVVGTTSSLEALALFEAGPSRFDVIITDQTMPDMTGVALAKAVHALRPDIPVILCTGFSHSVNAESAEGEGISAFVMKPLTKKELAFTLRRVLDRTTIRTDEGPVRQ